MLRCLSFTWSDFVWICCLNAKIGGSRQMRQHWGPQLEHVIEHDRFGLQNNAIEMNSIQKSYGVQENIVSRQHHSWFAVRIEFKLRISGVLSYFKFKFYGATALNTANLDSGQIGGGKKKNIYFIFKPKFGHKNTLICKPCKRLLKNWDISVPFSQNFTVSWISLNTSGELSNDIFVTIAITPFPLFKQTCQ